MKETSVKISIASLIVIAVLIGILHFVLISISFGSRQVVESTPEDVFLKPNRWYYVCVKEPHKLPCNSKCYACDYCGLECFRDIRGPKFVHDGKRKDNKKKLCGGPILTLMQDDGSMKYRCFECEQEWLTDPNRK